MRFVPPVGIEPSAGTSPVRRRAFARLVPLACLVAALALAGWSRLTALSTYGFSEDEAAKLQAIASFREGDFAVNAEHPLLMKLAIWATLDASDAWNRLASSWQLPAEAALRLPNAVAGIATIGALYAAVALLFSRSVAGVAALLVAFDPNVAAINRIGKEDTFLVFFFLLSVALYERAKQVGRSNPERAQRWYYASGAASGLMFASKYMPHLFGLYALYLYIVDRHPGANRPRRKRYYAIILGVFVLANFAILLPSTWEYCVDYVTGGRTIHEGYVYAGKVYPNSSTILLNGVPVTYYLHLIATKTPLPVLAGAFIGLIPLVTRRHERGFVWVRVLLVFQLIGYSIFASKFQRYALPMLVVVDVLAAAGFVAAAGWIQQRPWRADVRTGLCLSGAAAVIAVLAVDLVTAAPFFSLHRNVIGAALAPPATTFPEEAYDSGVREGIAAVASVARERAAIVTDTPMAAGYYVGKLRPDLQVRSLSSEGLAPHAEQWVFVQPARLYFENLPLVTQVRHGREPWREYRMQGTTVLEIFRLPR